MFPSASGNVTATPVMRRAGCHQSEPSGCTLLPEVSASDPWRSPAPSRTAQRSVDRLPMAAIDEARQETVVQPGYAWGARYVGSHRRRGWHMKQRHRRFAAMDRNVPRLCTLTLLSAIIVTTVSTLPASAHPPRITKPGAPTAVTATSLYEGASVSWTAPSSDGGSPITGYTVKASRGGQTCTTSGATTCSLTGLTDGRTYEVHVRAANAKGSGSCSPRVSVKPSLPTVEFGASVEFTYPSSTVGVVLSQPMPNPVQVDFTTSDGPEAALYWGAWSGAAFTFSPSSGIVPFPPGQRVESTPFAVSPATATGCG